VEVIREDELQEKLQMYHGTYHVGRDGMLEAMSREVWFPAMRREVDKWIVSCDECQQRSKSTWKTPLQPIVASRPMERWQMDFTGPYLYDMDVGGEIKHIKKSCLLLVDSYSKMKWADLFSTKKCEKVTNFVQLHCREEGKPDIIQSDNGGEFVGSELKQFCVEEGITGK